MNNFKITILIFLYVFTVSCANQKMSFSDKRINKLEKKGYKIILNNKVIHFKNYFLNKANILNTRKNTKEKTVLINLNAKAKILNGEKLLQETGLDNDFELFIVNGVPYEKHQFQQNIFIDVNSLKEKIILKKEEANKISHRQFNSDLLILKTE